MVAQTLTAYYTPPVDTITPIPPTETPILTPTAEITEETETEAAEVLDEPCDDAVFVSDITIPDNTVIAPYTPFTKTWSVRNTGTCDWTTFYKLKFYSGNKMNGHMAAVTSTVYAGQMTTFSIEMQAPETPGTYTGTWSMINDKGFYFGEFVTVTIVVK
jgi:hypothetical protein